MLTIILADTELELVPGDIRGHKAVQASAKRKGKKPREILLDASLHHSAMRRLDDWERRGRPDIAHMFVVLCLDSIANVEGRLRTLVHTRGDNLIEVDPSTRIPKNYNRFVGLMEDLFKRGCVPSEDKPLIRLAPDSTLSSIVDGIHHDDIIAFSPDGERGNLVSLFKGMEGDVVAIVGGFPKGDFTSPVYDLCTRKVSIHPELLKTWTVVSEILVSYNAAGVDA